MPIVTHRSRIYQLLEAPYGTTGQYTFRRGQRVAQNARNLLAGKVRTGRLRNSVVAKPPQRIPGRAVGITVQVGSFGIQYAKWVHEGTGIYGPHRSPIVPVRAQFLRFALPSGKIVYARSVRGVPPFPFMSLALEQETGRRTRGRR